MSIDEIYQMIDKFSEAAWRAKQAGLDAVELHAAHGYLIAQFMSPFTNRRTDRFGGSLENRMRFILEIISQIKEKCGDDFPILVRYSGDEFKIGGRDLEESKQVAKMLEHAGVAALDISAGTFDNAPVVMDPIYYPQGWRVYLAEEIKKVIKIPVIAAGTIRDPNFAERILREGRCDLVGLGRQLIADPEWANKAHEGRITEIRRCISCLVGCWQESLMSKTRMRCSINPVVGYEEELLVIKPAAKPKNVVVIGGGPAGMEAAYTAAKRGHRVTILEREGELGGQLRYCCPIPSKAKIRWFLDWQRNEVARRGIEVHTNVEVTPELLNQMSIDTLIIATGAKPYIPDLGPGTERIVPYTEILRCGRTSCENYPKDGRPEPVELKGRVVVFGDGYPFADTLEFLAGKGLEVIAITEDDELLPELEPVTREVLINRLVGIPTPGLKDAGSKHPVRIITRSKVTGFTRDGISIINKDFKEITVSCDYVVSCCRIPNSPENLSQIASEVYCVGDTNRPRNIRAAIYEGTRAARKI